MKHANVDGAVFDLGQCFVELAGAFGRDLEVILARHVRAEFEPDSLVQIWGDRIASFWPDGDTIIAVETLVFSAPGWQGPMTHFEVIYVEKWRAFSPLFERDEFQSALEWPEPRYLRAQIDPEDNINVLRSMHHTLLVDSQGA